MKLRVALYRRISTLTQLEKGYSLEAQLERMLAYCKAKDYEVVMNIEDPGYSGSNLERPGIARLIEAVENKVIDVVVVLKLDRLSRSQRDVLYMIEDVFLPNGVSFVSISESFDTTTPTGKAMVGLLSVFAELERSSITERFMSGRQQRARRSLWHGGGTDPIGYNYIDSQLELNEKEAYQVKVVYEMYAAGSSMTEISEYMQQQEYQTKHGGWSYLSTIANILDNPLYVGMIHFDGVIVPGSHEPIVNKDLNRKVKAMRERAKILAYKQTDSKHLLTGMIYCYKCGARYFAKKDKSRYYYCCHSRAKSNKAMVKDPNCKNENWRSADLEAEVVRQLIESAQNGVNRKIIPDFQAAIFKQIEAIDGEIKATTALYNDESQSIEQIAAKINDLTMKKNKLLQQAKLPERSESPERILQEIPHTWNMYDNVQRKRVLAQLVNRVIIDGKQVYIEWA